MSRDVLERLNRCAGSSESLVFDCVISTKNLWAGDISLLNNYFLAMGLMH